jgi:hypothetical protein
LRLRPVSYYYRHRFLRQPLHAKGESRPEVLALIERMRRALVEEQLEHAGKGDVQRQHQIVIPEID